jgi:hypothetical protein
VTFTAYVLLLNDKEVTVKGQVSLLPVGTGDLITIFLLTGTPGSCPFCAGGKVEQFVLVDMAAPLNVELTKDYTLGGRFTVSDSDDSGFHCRLHDAIAPSRISSENRMCEITQSCSPNADLVLFLETRCVENTIR